MSSSVGLKGSAVREESAWGIRFLFPFWIFPNKPFNKDIFTQLHSLLPFQGLPPMTKGLCCSDNQKCGADQAQLGLLHLAVLH
jgi:hypothetical protein